MSKYARNLAELTAKAVLHWPEFLREKQASLSVLPLLLETQEKFISLLNVLDSGPEAWRAILPNVAELNNTLFLKHLMVLSDLGGEALNKITPLADYFPQSEMHYVWREKQYAYSFQSFGKNNLHNKALGVDGTSLVKQRPLSAKMQDIIMLLLHGGAAYGDLLPAEVKEKCVIGSLLGDPGQVESFVKQNYIRVSQQLRGASSNALGNLAQQFVAETLKADLPDWHIGSGHIPGISHDDGNTETAFDIVAKSPRGHYFAIEVSFQVTTNSVIERKSGQAQARAALLHKAGHQICYVIDGAGNINVRKRAVELICRYSGCTVAFSVDEIRFLAQFLREHDKMKGTA